MNRDKAVDIISPASNRKRGLYPKLRGSRLPSRRPARLRAPRAADAAAPGLDDEAGEQGAAAATAADASLVTA